MNPPRGTRPPIRLLSAGAFLSMFDRYGAAPLLIPVAHSFGVPIQRATLVVTLYYFAYGLAQPLWGFLSDRWGRVRTIRWALAGACVSGAASALAPSIEVLTVARVLGAIAFCTVGPTTLVYIGDTVPFSTRHSVIADMLAAVAIGAAAATLVSGLFASLLTWRLTFVVPALVAPILIVALGRLSESTTTRPSSRAVAAQIRSAFRRPWVWFVVLFAIPEGAMVFGGLVYLPSALQAGGHSAAVSGLVVAAYGVTALVGTQMVKRVAARLAAWIMMAIGGLALIVGMLAAAITQDVASILFASAMLGGCYAFLHSGFQSWATDVAPEARGTATAMFATCTFVGAAASTALGSGLAGAGSYGRLFLITSIVALPIVAVAVVARAHYAGTDETVVPTPAQP